MNWKRRWSVIGVLSLAQVGIVICYQGFLKGSSAPANPPAEQTVVAEGPSAPPPPPLGVMPPGTVALPGPGVEPESSQAAPKRLPDLLPVAIPVPQAKELPISLIDPVPVALPPATRSPYLSRDVPREVVPVAASEKVPEERLKPMPVDPKALPPNGWLRGAGQELVVVQAGTPPLPGVGPLAGAPAAEPKGLSPIVHGAAPTAGTPPQPPPQSTPPGLLPSNPGSTTPPPPTAAPQTQEPPLTELTTCPWVLRVEIVKGRTLMTAQSGKDVQFRVSCDKLELQAPRGSILAAGNVSVSSEGLQGSCDQLTIAWQKDQVVLEGRAELKCHRDGQEVDLKAAKLSLRLSVPNGVEATATGAMSRSKTRTVIVRPSEEGAPREVPVSSWERTDDRPPPAESESRNRKKTIRMPEID